MNLRKRTACLLGLAVSLCALSGCGSDRSELDILPDTEKARAALDKALTAWKNGQKAGLVQGAEAPAIQVLDSVWQSGARLVSYEIGQAVEKPAANGPGPRWFVVKLTLQDAEPQTVNYAVLGLDPLWVEREQDYLQSCGMSDN